MKILRFLKNYKKESLLAPLFKMMEAIFDLLVPLVVARIIDDGIRRGNTRQNILERKDGQSYTMVQ